MSSHSSDDDFGFEEEPVRIMSVKPVFSDDNFSDEEIKEETKEEQKHKKNKRKSKKKTITIPEEQGEEEEEQEVEIKKPKKNKRKSKKKTITIPEEQEEEQEEQEEQEEVMTEKKNKRKSKKIVKEKLEKKSKKIKPKRKTKKITPVPEEDEGSEISDVDELINKILEEDSENDDKILKESKRRGRKKKVIIIEESSDDEGNYDFDDKNPDELRLRSTSQEAEETELRKVRLTKNGKPDKRCYRKRTERQMEAVKKMVEGRKKSQVIKDAKRKVENRELLDEAYDHRLSQLEKKRTELKRIALEKKMKGKEERLRLANEALDRILSGKIEKVEETTPDLLTPEELQTATDYMRKHR